MENVAVFYERGEGTTLVIISNCTEEKKRTDKEWKRSKFSWNAKQKKSKSVNLGEKIEVVISETDNARVPIKKITEIKTKEVNTKWENNKIYHSRKKYK